MGFKSMNQYIEEKRGDFFVLPNDNDFADVIFLYRSIEDPVVADVHYISSKTGGGFFFCCGDGCPACQPIYGKDHKGPLRIDHKLFIPLYNITSGRIEIWDRSIYFRNQLIKDVFTPYPDPSGYVFRITRHGEANDRETKYSIEAINTNNTLSIEAILTTEGKTMEQVYEMACKEITPFEMKLMLDNNNSTAASPSAYGATPRPAFTAPQQIAPPDMPLQMPNVTLPTFNQAPTDIPGVTPQVPVDPIEPATEIPTESDATTPEELPELDDLTDTTF